MSKPTVRSSRVQRLYTSYQRTIPLWYLISILFGIFVYISRRGHSITEDIDIFHFTDEYQQDTATNDLYPLASLKKAVELEDFPFTPDVIVLPIAPYKHVQEKLDFRATLTIYLEAIKNFVKKSTTGGQGLQPPVFNFDWKDFVDLNILKPLLEEKPNCFRIGALGATSRTSWPDCLDEPQNLGFVFITPSLEPETEFRLSIRGKSYLLTAAPLPQKLIFLAGELAFVTRVGKKVSLEDGQMIDEYVQRKVADSISATPDQIVKRPVNPIDEIDEISTILGRDLSNFNAPKESISNLDISSFEAPINKEKSILADAARHYDDRHFRNVQLKSKDGKWVSDEYYDWRFFNKKLNNLNKRVSLHNIVENYLQFCKNIGITTWLATDSLISWRENGLIGPWEDTVRFELPASDLTRLANSFNYSLIISDPRNETGSYLIDVSPWYLERAIFNDGGASPDTMDARVIDTKTGAYIELSGVVRAPRVPKEMVDLTGDASVDNYLVTGKGNFWYSPKLLPLRRTLYEGKVANVPGELVEDLPQHPSNYVFHEHLRLFVDERKCSYVPEEEKDKFDLSYIGCCHDNLIWKEYNYTKHASAKFIKNNGLPLNLLDEVKLEF